MSKTITLLALLILCLTLVAPTLAQDITPDPIPSPTPTPSYFPDTPLVAPAQDNEWITAALLSVVAILALGVLRSNQQLAKSLGESVPYKMIAPQLYGLAKKTAITWDDATLEAVAESTGTKFEKTPDGKGYFVSTPTANIATTEENK